MSSVEEAATLAHQHQAECGDAEEGAEALDVDPPPTYEAATASTAVGGSVSIQAASSTEDAGWDRALLITKPEQSGKTFVMIQQINKFYREAADDRKVINFIFCDNNLLLSKQTGARLQRDVDELPDTNEKYIELSSRKGSVKSWKEAGFDIGQHDTRNVICCTNKTRGGDINSIIQSFNTSSNTRGKYIFKIWLDEADKYIGIIDKRFRPMLSLNENVELICLTATAKPLLDKYQWVNTFSLKETTNPDYHGWGDNTLVLHENKSGTVEGFIHEVLSDHPHLQQAGTKWYIPANRKKTSHEQVRDTLLFKKFAVFVVNGDGLALTLPSDPEKHNIEKKNEELNIQMRRMYEQYSVAQFPVAITGDICISRGISIMSPDFMFDAAILSCTRNPNQAEISQKAGRLKGNIKTWPGYKPPVVYTTQKFDDIATKHEGWSRDLARVAFEKEEKGDDQPKTTEAFFETTGQGRSKAVKEYLLLGGVKVVEKTEPTDEQLEPIVTYDNLEDAARAAKEIVVALNKEGCSQSVNEKGKLPVSLPQIHYEYKYTKQRWRPDLHSLESLWKKGKSTLKKGHWKDATTWTGSYKDAPVAIRKVSETEERYVVLVKLPVPTP